MSSQTVGFKQVKPAILETFPDDPSEPEPIFDRHHKDTVVFQWWDNGIYDWGILGSGDVIGTCGMSEDLPLDIEVALPDKMLDGWYVIDDMYIDFYSASYEYPEEVDADTICKGIRVARMDEIQELKRVNVFDLLRQVRNALAASVGLIKLEGNYE